MNILTAGQDATAQAVFAAARDLAYRYRVEVAS